MLNKRGLSTVVTTLILILLIIAAVAGIWTVIGGLLTEGAGQIGFGGLTLDLVIKNASIDYDTGIATVQVTRNAGGLGEEITSIKFIVEDTKNSEVFEMETTNFVELSSRTFIFNLSESEILILEDVYKISIAPVYIPGAGGIEGETKTGGISDSVGDLNVGLNISQEINPEKTICSIKEECGVDFWVENTQTCSGDNTAVNQYKTVYSCILGFCQNVVSSFPKEVCAEGLVCYAGACAPETNPCANETVERDCGIDGFVGFSACATNPESIVQDYRKYSCVNEECTTKTTTELIEECLEGEVCSSAECFIPLECTKDEDCSLGEVCEEGSCVAETVILNGSILSAWPNGVGEYFDSVDLPTVADIDYGKYFIIFPGSLETRCMQILNFVDSPTLGANSYIRLNESETNISANNYFEIWKTEYSCTLI